MVGEAVMGGDLATQPFLLQNTAPLLTRHVLQSRQPLLQRCGFCHAHSVIGHTPFLPGLLLQLLPIESRISRFLKGVTIISTMMSQ